MLYFNPHEREARDATEVHHIVELAILIHTSVKLVTSSFVKSFAYSSNFNPHEREARDWMESVVVLLVAQILIHTSVKLVTSSSVPRVRWG